MWGVEHPPVPGKRPRPSPDAANPRPNSPKTARPRGRTHPPPTALDAAVQRPTAPALVVWGETDPYIPVAFASAYASALGGPVDVDVRPGVGHWPWLEDPIVIDHVAEFLAG